MRPRAQVFAQVIFNQLIESVGTGCARDGHVASKPCRSFFAKWELSIYGEQGSECLLSNDCCWTIAVRVFLRPISDIHLESKLTPFPDLLFLRGLFRLNPALRCA